MLQPLHKGVSNTDQLFPYGTPIVKLEMSTSSLFQASELRQLSEALLLAFVESNGTINEENNVTAISALTKSQFGCCRYCPKDGTI